MKYADYVYEILVRECDGMGYPDGEKMPLTIQNELGICVIMPVFIHDGTRRESCDRRGLTSRNLQHPL